MPYFCFVLSKRSLVSALLYLHYMNSYPVAQTGPEGHSWGIDSDYKNRLIYQKCTCGWKARVREFDGALSLYDNAANWANHFDAKKLSEI